jgi:two-component system chemotaxis response regulator CheY
MGLCLIVDDSGTIRKILRGMMEEFGFDCIEAQNGHEALDHYNKFTPDIILLDWNMPVMTGIEFMQTLNKETNGQVPPVIFCTTETDMQHITMAMEAGAADYIMKPFERDMLKDKLINLGFLES